MGHVFGRKFGRAFENRESSTYVFFTVSRSLAIFNGENSTSSIPEEKTKKDFSRRLADGVLSEFWVFQEKVDMKVSAFSFTTSLLVFGYL